MDYQENIENKKFLKEIERSYFEMYKPFNLSPNSTDGSCTLYKMYLMIIYERHMHTYHSYIDNSKHKIRNLAILAKQIGTAFSRRSGEYYLTVNRIDNYMIIVLLSTYFRMFSVPA